MMKKLVLGLLVTALMSLGIAGTMTVAQAEPYPGTVKVKTDKKIKIDTKKKAKKAAKIKLRTSGDLTPTGKAKVVCKAGKKKVKSDKALSKKGIAKTGKLGKGKWTCTVKYKAAPGSPFKSGKYKVAVRVR